MCIILSRFLKFNLCVNMTHETLTEDDLITQADRAYYQREEKIIEQARQMALDAGKISVPFLQRKMRLNFEKAKQIVNRINQV